MSFLAKENLSRRLPKFTPQELFTMFPAAKQFTRKLLEDESREARECLRTADELEKVIDDLIYRKCSKENEWFIKMLLEGVYLTPLRQGKEKILKRNAFLLSKKKHTSMVTPAMVEQARNYPMENLIEFSNKTAFCIFHEEKTGSFHFYEKQNRAYCFGCNKAADVIDVYRQIKNCSFIEAVKQLSQ